MRTLSQSRNSNRKQQQVPQTFVEPFDLEEPIDNPAPPVVTMADNPTMAQLLEAPNEGYEDAIVVPEITTNNFELKHGLLTFVQNKQFFGHDKEDPHAHIRYFNKITFTMKFPNVPNSLNSAAGGNFLDNMPRDCLRIIESKSKVRNSCNKPVVAKVGTSTFTPDISPDVAALTTDVAELKDMIKTLILHKQKSQAPATVKAVEEKCVTYAYQAPAYQAPAPQTQGVSKTDFESYVKANDAVMQNMQSRMTNITYLLTKIANSNAASTSGSGSLPSNTVANPKGELKAITTRSGASYDGPQVPPLTSSLPKVVENEPDVTKDTVPPTNNTSTKDVQPPVVYVETQNFKPVVAPVSALMPKPKPSIMYPSRRNDERHREKANDQIEKFYEIFKDLSFEINLIDALILMPKFASPLKALIGNKEKLSEMARTPLNEHCSAVILNKLPKKLADHGKFLIPFVDFDADPRVPLVLGRSFLKTGHALIDVYEGELTLRVGKEAITFNLDQTSRYSSNYNDMMGNRIDAIEMACEEYSQEVLGFSDVIASGNPTPYYDPIVSTSSPTLTSFGDSDFLLEEVDTFLALEDDPTSPEVDHSYYDSEGDILFLEAFLNDAPSLPPPTQEMYLPEIRKELKVCEAKNDKSSIDEPPKVELKDLPPHLEYAFLEGDDKLPVIIAKDLSVEEKAALIKVLKSHK
ncbi:hypothetical protein Tco_0989496 [Tanacetum coccineum]|uniref:Reverse transcriptase domain-containing protein n=1 Tax=Tanacetum coccineum TaxID=301880 RepID=A0ABQ5EV72_9ASTR